MRIIAKIAEYIEEELEGAEEYAKCALKHKDDHPTLAKTFHDMSSDEMRHVNLLHEEVVRLIEAHRREHGEPPAAMMAVWEYAHEKHIKSAAKIKVLQNEFKGM